MFKIIWESKKRERLAQISEANNEQYLVQSENEYEILGELSTSTYDVFVGKDMDKLVEELRHIGSIVSDVNASEHIEEIIELALKCKDLENSRLIFTPF